jgi:hypothetical protein
MNAPLLLLALALGADPGGPICAAPAAGAVEACTPAGEAALRELLIPLFGLIDGPVTPEMWRALPPEALPLLERIADGRGRDGARARALEGAASLGSDGAIHRRLANDGAAPFAVRAAAIRGLGLLVPASRLDAELAPLLERDPDLRIRSTAAAARARTATTSRCAAVRAQAQREGAAGRPAFQRALTACGDR